MGRPQRRRRGDRLLNPGATAAQIECDFAMAGFDEAAKAMERKWGIDRLPALCTQETARKYGRAIAKLNEAIDAEDPNDVARFAGACHRGLIVMDKEATEAGAQPLTAKAVQCEFEGTTFTAIGSVEELQAYEKAGNEIVFTMREFAVVMKEMKLDGGLVKQMKEHFPNAGITKFESKLGNQFWKSGGDEIPF